MWYPSPSEDRPERRALDLLTTGSSDPKAIAPESGKPDVSIGADQMPVFSNDTRPGTHPGSEYWLP